MYKRQNAQEARHDMGKARSGFRGNKNEPCGIAVRKRMERRSTAASNIIGAPQTIASFFCALSEEVPASSFD